MDVIIDTSALIAVIVGESERNRIIELTNGNTLIVAVQYDGPNHRTYEGDDESTIIEVTPNGEVAWQLTLKGYPADLSPGHFYKAERIGAESTVD